VYPISIQKTIPGPQMKARLRRWIGRLDYQMDFRMRNGMRGGLSMNLLPGSYWGTNSRENAVSIREATFWYLEWAILKRCPAYCGDSHYGVTAIPREEWMDILAEWKVFKERLLKASIPIQMGITTRIPLDFRITFLKDFPRNRKCLIRLIEQLSEWVRNTLANWEEISVCGI
jgi:hypothetical protein